MRTRSKTPPTAAVRRAWRKDATITDPEALLRALDRAAEPAPRASCAPSPVLAPVTAVLPPPPAPPPPPRPVAALPTLLPNESLVRVGSNAVVIVRRRVAA